MHRRANVILRGALSSGLLLCLVCGEGSLRGEERTEERVQLTRFESLWTLPESISWARHAPQVKTISVRSTADGTAQPALYYDSGSARKKPLLVALHSWSFDYRQAMSVPYADWCRVNDWVFIHPDYRGVFDDPDATGSELAVRDILDATSYALEHANIDRSRVYLIGFSGGAMTALVMAGRYPAQWSAVAAFVPIFDLVDWYRYVRRFPERHYAGQIISSCSGVPREGSPAARDCLRRSPRTYLSQARGTGLPIYLAHGIRDDFAPPGHSLRAFNLLVERADRIAPRDIRYIDRTGRLPSHLARSAADPLFRRAGHPLLFRRRSAAVTVSLFRGGHDMIYNAGLHWLSRQSRSRPR